jgi:hypothetical protein
VAHLAAIVKYLASFQRAAVAAADRAFLTAQMAALAAAVVALVLVVLARLGKVIAVHLTTAAAVALVLVVLEQAAVMGLRHQLQEHL